MYVDVETTGLDPRIHAIVEVGASVTTKGGLELASFSSLVNPGAPALAGADPEAFEVNGIKMEELHEAPPPEAVAFKFLAFLEAHQATRHAFNTKFERGFLGNAPWLVPLDWDECVQKAAREIMVRARAYRSDGWGPSLKRAAEFFDVKIPLAHRALPDARTAARIHWEILEQRSLDHIEDEAIQIMGEGM